MQARPITSQPSRVVRRGALLAVLLVPLLLGGCSSYDMARAEECLTAEMPPSGNALYDSAVLLGTLPLKAGWCPLAGPLDQLYPHEDRLAVKRALDEAREYGLYGDEHQHHHHH